MSSSVPRVAAAALLGLALVAIVAITVALSANHGRSGYDLAKELLIPMLGPLVAVVVPLLIFIVIPRTQNRERFALDLCAQYNSEEMRLARNAGWEQFVTRQKRLPPVRRAEALNAFLDYLTTPEGHCIDAAQDAVYQRTTRVLDFFALVNDCLARKLADPGVVRSFLLYYYLWWRDEIMDPLRRTRRMAVRHPKYMPGWWQPLTHLDALAPPMKSSPSTTA